MDPWGISIKSTNVTYTYLVYCCSSYKFKTWNSFHLLYVRGTRYVQGTSRSGRLRPLRSLIRENGTEWQMKVLLVDGPTLEVQTGDLQMPRAPWKQHPDAACMLYVHASFDTSMYWSACTWFAALCNGDSLCFAVHVCARGVVYCCYLETQQLKCQNLKNEFAQTKFEGQ